VVIDEIQRKPELFPLLPIPASNLAKGRRSSSLLAPLRPIFYANHPNHWLVAFAILS